MFHINVAEYIYSNVHTNQTSKLVSYDLHEFISLDQLFFIITFTCCTLLFLEIIQFMHLRALMCFVQELTRIEESFLSEQTNKTKTAKPKPTRRSERLKLGR
jgi:hypothetical protein